MQSSARQIDHHEGAVTMRPRLASATRSSEPREHPKPRRHPVKRPGRVEALREELAHIAHDIGELTSDFESRVGPLTKAYVAALAKLEKLAPTPNKRPPPQRQKYGDARG